MHQITKPIVLGLVLLLPGLVRADAPTEQYGSYLSSQLELDDLQTHLKWERFVNPTATLLNGVQCRVGRFPSVRELATLVDNEPAIAYDEQGAAKFVYIDANAFPGTPRGPFWTSTATPEGMVFVVDFGTGEISLVDPTLATTKAHLRCVTNI